MMSTYWPGLKSNDWALTGFSRSETMSRVTASRPVICVVTSWMGIALSSSSSSKLSSSTVQSLNAWPRHSST